MKSIMSGNSGKRKLAKVDFAAFVMLLLLIFYLSLCARNGIGVPDEAFYLAFPQRVFNGDGLISDEWHVAQFSSFIIYPFYVLFRWIVGSTEGIILYFRWLYIVFQCVSVSICWSAFRRYGWKGLLGLSYFAFSIPVSVMAVSYYTFPQWSAIILASAFLRERKPGKPLLFSYGALFALLVVSQPLTALLWFVYTGAVLVLAVDARRETPRFRRPFLLLPRTFRFLLYGVLAVAAPFLFFLFKNNSLPEIAANFGYLFTGGDHHFATGEFFFSSSSLKSALGYYGIIPAVGIAALTLFALLTRRHRAALRPLILFALLLLTTLAYFNSRPDLSDRKNYLWCSLMFFGMPLFLSGPVFMLLLDNRDKRLEAFWWGMFAVGLLTDLSSNVIIGSVMFSAGAASAVLMLLLLSECFRSFRANGNRWKKLACAVASISLAFVGIDNIGADVLFNIKRTEITLIEDCTAYDFNEGKTDMLLEEGPMKGLYTTATIHRIYTAYLHDLDEINESRTGAFYVYGLNAFMYLYLYDAPSAAFSPWYVRGDEERQWEYFRLHPDKMPEYIYVPRYNALSFHTLSLDRADLTVAHKMQNLRNWFECDVTEGEAGTIVRVINVKRNGVANLT